MRPLFIALHKYLGLLLGLLLSFIGVTGSILVFDHALDEAIAPETVNFVLTETRAPIQDVFDAAQAAVEGNPGPTRVQIARKPGSPHVVRFRAPEGAPGPIEVSVSPVDAKILAVRGWGESDYLMSWMYRLHYTLLAGDTGKKVVGTMGLFLLFFCISGLVVWWPSAGRWRRALTIKRDAGSFRFNFDLHKTAGIYFLLVLVVVAFSGVRLIFQQPVEKVVATVLPIEERPAPPSRGQGDRIDADQAIALGRQVFPDGELKRVFLPQGPEDSYQLAFNLPGEPWTHHAASAVWVDQYSGEVLAVYDVTKIAAGSKFIAWQFPLHNGDALGLAGRWLVFFSGFVLPILFGTGLYMWWRKRRPRKARLREGAMVAGEA